MRDVVVPQAQQATPRGLSLPGTMTKTGWQLPAGMTIEEWVECGRSLEKIEGAVQWWLGDWWRYGEHEYGERVAALQEGGPLEGMNFGTLRNYAWVAGAIETSRRRDVVSFGHHQAVASLTVARQDKWLDRAERDELSVNKLRAAIKQGAARDRTRSVEMDAAAIGKFPVIYADPPWQYENPPMGGTNRSIENQYPTMTLEKICALPVAEIAHEDSVLLMWATAPKLAECLQVITAWGFEYRTNMVWIKDKIGMGYYVRNMHEHLLIAKRGNLPPPTDTKPASVVEGAGISRPQWSRRRGWGIARNRKSFTRSSTPCIPACASSNCFRVALTVKAGRFGETRRKPAL